MTLIKGKEILRHPTAFAIGLRAYIQSLKTFANYKSKVHFDAFTYEEWSTNNLIDYLILKDVLKRIEEIHHSSKTRLQAKLAAIIRRVCFSMMIHKRTQFSYYNSLPRAVRLTPDDTCHRRIVRKKKNNSYKTLTQRPTT